MNVGVESQECRKEKSKAPTSRKEREKLGPTDSLCDCQTRATRLWTNREWSLIGASGTAAVVVRCRD
jgi:hypothetical protein